MYHRSWRNGFLIPFWPRGFNNSITLDIIITHKQQQVIHNVTRKSSDIWTHSISAGGVGGEGRERAKDWPRYQPFHQVRLMLRVTLILKFLFDVFRGDSVDLSVINPRREKSGVYKVIFRNAQGQDERDINVNIMGNYKHRKFTVKLNISSRQANSSAELQGNGRLSRQCGGQLDASCG